MGVETAPAKPLTSGDVARIFNVHPSTVIEWADSGKLRSFRTPGGQRRFWPDDVEAFFVPSEPTEAAS